MGRPENGIYIVQGEINVVVTALKRNSRWNSHSHNDYENEPLLNTFTQLKDVLNNIADLEELTPNEFLGAFLEVIRSEDTTGPITGLALTSVNKFLSYGLIDEKCETAAAAIENIADAVTHARFVGTDPSSDEVVLMKILHVLRTMMLTPAGRLLTNESVCEIMQSCFRICFEMRLSELLRKSAEHTLMDMVQLLFTRLPQFLEDPKWALSLKKLKMKTGGMDAARKLRKKSPKVKQKKSAPPPAPHQQPPTQQMEETRQADKEGGEQRLTNTDEQEGETKVAAPPNSFPDSLPSTAEPSQVLSPEEELAQAGEVIATTPVAATKSLVDIQQGFQDVDEEEERALSPPPTPHTISIAPDKDGTSHLCAEDDLEADISVEVSEQLTVELAEDLPQTSSEGPSSQTQEMERLGVPEEMSKSESDLEPVCSEAELESMGSSGHVTQQPTSPDKEYINQQGVRFMPHHPHTHGPLIPYGLPCVRELFRFLVSLTNPVDRHNTDVMIHMGLNLLTVAMESGADHISHYSSLMCLVKDDMCKNLFFLLQSERLSLFAASIRVCFLLFESMRSHLKFQLEMYFTKLMDVITSESPKISYEQHEMALESVVQLLRVPGLVTELYMNYDCDLYCSSLFEDLTKLLSKNAFPVSGIFSTHLLSLDALLAVIDSIEQHCHHRILATATEASKANTTYDGKEDDSRDSPSVESSAPPLPPPSGYTVGKKTTASPEVTQKKGREKTTHKPRIRPNRMKVLCDDMPTEEQLMEVKRKKKLYQTGTEQFNIKPSKGIAFLQEHNLLSKPVDPHEVALFLREDPKLDKKQIGEYISNKKNTAIIEAFMRSFNFEDTRLDEALRMFLESFRLPGEAPVISYIMEHFSGTWHKTVGEPFANCDAAFTLTYAIIMLNVDQHNQNAKKQNRPMVIEEFKKNVKACNGKKDFDQDMLEEIFNAVASDEIVMPSEQSGLVRENYLWKLLLKRGNGKEGTFTHAPTGYYDRDLFSLVWGPTVAALSFIFDKSSDNSIVQKSTSGFRKCALIAAHYGMSDVFDNLVISLCKFTTLLSNMESQESIPILFGSNMKAKLAARTVFGLAHRHGDILREGWKNILDCMLQLYRGKMLPEVLITVEDFLDPTGRISLLKEEKQTIPRNDSGVLSSFYSYFTLTETPQQRGPSAEEQEAIKQAQACIDDCHVEQLIQESKFLRIDSLQELMKALIFASRPENQESLNNGNNHFEEESAIFYLELLVKVVLQNRDRVTPFWQSLRDHLYHLVVNAEDQSFLVERAVVGLLRIAIRLLRREDIAPQVLSSLRILLTMKPRVIHAVCKQIAFGLHDLLKTNAANIHSMQDWFTLFTLLEVSGAGAHPPPIMEVNGKVNVPESISDAGAQSDSEVSTDYSIQVAASCQREYQSDSELYDAPPSKNKSSLHQEAEVRPLPSAGSWQMVSAVNREDVSQDSVSTAQQEPPQTNPSLKLESVPSIDIPINQFNITLSGELVHHDNKALVKSCETLAFLVRDAAHITPHNFESCVHCLRTYVEASIDGGQQARQQRKAHQMQQQQQQQKQREKKRFRKKQHMKKSSSSPSHLHPLTDSEEEEQHDSYRSLSIQLLDLMHTLHTRAASIFSSWAEEEEEQKPTEQPQQQDPSTHTTTSLPTEGDVATSQGGGATSQGGAISQGGTLFDAKSSSLWLKCWCPLLQGIARLCCDTRRHVRSQALTYLQRALLVHDLQTLSPAEWENCFNKVLFPLLHLLLENNDIDDPGGIEETRMRASTLLCKVFLQHLTPLLSLSTFTALWLTILDFMDKYMHADNSDLLCEAIPESLKNMLLVMHTAGILSTSSDESQLWKLTWDRIDTFLPNLRDEVFKPHQMEPRRPVMDREPTPEEGVTSATTTPRDGTGPACGEAPQTSQPTSAVSSPQSTGVSETTQQTGQHTVAQTASPTPSLPDVVGQQDSPPRSGSPLIQAPTPPASTGGYILHPPLPQMSSPGGNQGVLPIILNPELMQGSPIPIIHSQGTPEKKPELTAAQHSVVRDY